MTSLLIPNSTLQSAYATQLPDHLLYSEDFYCTQEAYSVLLNFTDDTYLQELFDTSQLSDRFMEVIDIRIDELFEAYNCPDVFSNEALELLRSYISQQLNKLDLTKAIIK